MVKCMECGRDFKRVSNTHLKFHNLTMAQYKQKYPGSPMECESYCKNMSHAGENHPLYGIGHTLESRKKMSLSRMGPKNHRYGKKLPEWQKQLMIEANKKRWKNKTFEEVYGKEKAEELRQRFKENVAGYWTGKHLSEEHKKKLSALKQGYKPVCSIKPGQYALEKHPNWQGGKSFEPYSLDFNRKFKKLIKERDGGCLLCNISMDDLHQIKRKVHIHHVNYNKLDTFPQNCCTLCNSCHMKTNFNRIHWTKFFQSLLNEKYNYDYTEDQKIVITLRTS